MWKTKRRVDSWRQAAVDVFQSGRQEGAQIRCGKENKVNHESKTSKRKEINRDDSDLEDK